MPWCSVVKQATPVHCGEPLHGSDSPAATVGATCLAIVVHLVVIVQRLPSQVVLIHAEGLPHVSSSNAVRRVLSTSRCFRCHHAVADVIAMNAPVLRRAATGPARSSCDSWAARPALILRCLLRGSRGYANSAGTPRKVATCYPRSRRNGEATHPLPLFSISSLLQLLHLTCAGGPHGLA